MEPDNALKSWMGRIQEFQDEAAVIVGLLSRAQDVLGQIDGMQTQLNALKVRKASLMADLAIEVSEFERIAERLGMSDAASRLLRELGVKEETTDSKTGSEDTPPDHQDVPERGTEVSLPEKPLKAWGVVRGFLRILVAQGDPPLTWDEALKRLYGENHDKAGFQSTLGHAKSVYVTFREDLAKGDKSVTRRKTREVLDNLFLMLDMTQQQREDTSLVAPGLFALFQELRFEETSKIVEDAFDRWN